MKIKPFKVEEWMNEYEEGAKYNIAETCSDSISLDALFQLVGRDKDAFLAEFCARRLTYGDIWGAPLFREGVCKLYRTMEPENIIPTHGAAGANHHVFYSLLEPGDRIVSIMPTYQQLYSIPESLGVAVDLLKLRPQDGYHPDLSQLAAMVTDKTQMICINNPNNPTGALLEKEELLGIIEIARKADAWVLCDEVYRHLTQKDEWCDSVADLYEKGISVSGMSKVFSLAGLRLGWIATGNKEAIQTFLSHRDYTLISCGMFDEQVAGIALAGADRLLERNRGLVRGNLARLSDWVGKQPHVSWHKPQAGTTALAYYDLDIPSREFCSEMYHRTGAFVTPGECFEMEYSMRIGYACAPEVLEAGLLAMDQYIGMKIKEGTPLRKEKDNG